MSDFKVNDFLKLCELGKGIPSEAKEFGPYEDERVGGGGGGEGGGGVRGLYINSKYKGGGRLYNTFNERVN